MNLKKNAFLNLRREVEQGPEDDDDEDDDDEMMTRSKITRTI